MPDLYRRRKMPTDIEKTKSPQEFPSVERGFGETASPECHHRWRSCMPGREGRSVFLDMRRRKANAILYCFDLLWLNNEDLWNLHLVERKLRLRHLVRTSRNRSLLYASHMERHGVRLFQAICEQDCEGIVGKYKRGTYATKPVSWVKVLNPSYSQMRGREEMFERFRERREHVESR
jgi:hypothetical protein